MVISAVDKNLKASANSINPRITFTVVSQPPDFGNECNHCGNKANKVNGNANAIPKPSKPKKSDEPPITKSVPIIGPVQEKDTKASVNAIKNTPKYPPLPERLSVLFAHEDGKVISNKPKKDKAKMIKTTKNNKLNHTFVDIALSASEPKTLVIIKPNDT